MIVGGPQQGIAVNQLVQQCATIGFSFPGAPGQQQFVANAQTCAALGLISQNQNQNQNQNQDIVAQCALLGLQPGANVNANVTAVEGQQQQQQEQEQQQQNQEAEAQQTEAMEKAKRQEEQQAQTQEQQQQQQQQGQISIAECLAQGFVQVNGTAANPNAQNETAAVEARMVRRRIGNVMMN